MIRSAALVAVAALLLSACNGDDDGTAEEVASTTTAIDASSVTTVSAAPTAVTSTSLAATTTIKNTTTTVAADEGVSLGPLGSTQVDITTDDGSIQIGSGTIPAAAADVPVPDDLEVQLASASGDSAGFSGRTARTPAELAAFYRSELPRSGFEIVDDQTVGSTVFIVFVRSGETGQVAISETPGRAGATIIVAFGPA